MFTKCGRGQLNSGGDRRARLYGGDLYTYQIDTVKTAQDGRYSGWGLTQ